MSGRRSDVDNVDGHLLPQRCQVVTLIWSGPAGSDNRAAQRVGGPQRRLPGPGQMVEVEPAAKQPAAAKSVKHGAIPGVIGAAAGLQHQPSAPAARQRRQQLLKALAAAPLGPFLPELRTGPDHDQASRRQAGHRLDHGLPAVGHEVPPVQLRPLVVQTAHRGPDRVDVVQGSQDHSQDVGAGIPPGVGAGLIPPADQIHAATLVLPPTDEDSDRDCPTGGPGLTASGQGL